MLRVKLPSKRLYSPLKTFLSRGQAMVIGDCLAGEEGEWFEQKMLDMAKLVENMPKVYEQDGKGDDAIVTLHYFIGNCDWWITERDTSAEQHQAFGYANIGYGAEMGYISIAELIENRVELDLHFTPCTVRELKAKGEID